MSVGINPSEIVIPALDDYVDLNRSYFEFELRLNTAATNPGITADDDTKSTAGASKYIYQVNNLAHSILKNIGVKLNGHQLNNDSNLYPYQAFFQTLLNYDRSEGETLLAPQGWVNQLDVPPEMEATGGGDDDRPTTEGLKHADAFALKTATTKFSENKSHSSDETLRAFISHGKTPCSRSGNWIAIVFLKSQFLSVWNQARRWWTQGIRHLDHR